MLPKKKKKEERTAPYMTKALRKTIMKRSKVETRFYKTKVVKDGVFFLVS